MSKEIKFREDLKKKVSELKSARSVYGFFKFLGYPEGIVLDVYAKRKKETFDFKKEDSEKVKKIYSVLSFDEKLPVFLVEVSVLSPKFIRAITTKFDRQYLHFLLVFTIDYSQIVFVFPNREKIQTGKHRLVLTKLILDKKEIHYTDIIALSNIIYQDTDTWRDVWKNWKRAFSVERVTKDFFEDYKKIFFSLRNELNKKKISRKESHEFALQFLNRLMFIYFISKKKWLQETKFIHFFWTAYKNQNKYGSDEFYHKWLRQVFFKAFNNKSNELKWLPDKVIKALSDSPYLNGGLFRENSLDNIQIKISDLMFKRVYEFFEKYSFTIKEDMPLDQEVAVDPQMIGYVYESLANVAEEIYDRSDLGIFYTPKVEVDFMCRKSFVEYLSNHMPDVAKDKVYHLVFDLPEDKSKIEKLFDKEKIWQRLENILDNLSVIDPACGSGAFLVGMLDVISEIYRIVYNKIGRRVTDFDLKFGIIQRSLYGVDVMPWAVHAGELRLWLQLIVETELLKDELRKQPLLPNLNLNLRVGDSLVQEIGGIAFNVRTNDLKPYLKKKLDELKNEKRKYFENSRTAKFSTPKEVEKEEIRLFEEIIDERIESFNSDISVYENDIKRNEKQMTLSGEVDIREERKNQEKEEKIEFLEKDIGKLKKVRGILKDPEKKPFVWDIDFAEIFGDKKGFDIVIGNPPYVRQEMISPPDRIKSEVKVEDKREYKDKLISSVKARFPIIKSINKKSDYYIYFYFHGLSLLNEKGTFCFITSNSWLDVGYGVQLQEFLCKYVPIIAIYDNPKRSFAHADVNTIIAVFGAPVLKQEKIIAGFKVEGNGGYPLLDYTSKFVMFKKPFEEVINTNNLIEIENTNISVKGEGITELVKNVVKTPEYRVFPVLQKDLLEDGWEYPEHYKNGRFKAGQYSGNKWGSKYLRAPDIFHKILEKGKDKLILLGELTEKTQRNTLQNFRKIAIVKDRSNDDYPYLSSFKDIDTIKVDVKKLSAFIKRTTKKTINYPITDIISNRFLGERLFFIEGGDFVVSDTFFVGFLKEKNQKRTVVQLLNSTLSLMATEVIGRKNLGGGLLTIYGPEMKSLTLLNPKKISGQHKKALDKNYAKIFRRKINSIWEECGIDKSKPIHEQEPKPLSDRAELDKIIFDELGLTKEERKEVYWAVCELVKQRLEKSKSLKKE